MSSRCPDAGTRTGARPGASDLVVAVREEDTGLPVAGATVVLDGLVSGMTNARGEATLARRGVPDYGGAQLLYVFRALDYLPLVLALHPLAAARGFVEATLERQPPPPEDGIGWGLAEIGGALPPPPGFERVRIGVLDTGIDAAHPCVNVRGAIPPPAGRQGEDRPISPHGTFAAALIGGIRVDGCGVWGVLPGASLYDVPVFDERGAKATGASIVAGVEWAIEHRLDVLHLGFGARHENYAWRNAWRLAWEAGIVLIAPAGNTSNEDQSVMYPARSPETIAVAACARTEDTATEDEGATLPRSEDDRLCMPRFSCRGPEVDLVAPGVKVCSIAPGLPGGRVLYDHCTGTSEAAAFVTGAAARLLAEHPELLEDRSRGRAETVRAALRERARPLGFGTHREGAGLVRIDTLGGPFRGG